MKSFASTPDDLREMLNPKPVGDTKKSHVHEAVKEPEPDFEEMQRFVENPDYRKVFK